MNIKIRTVELEGDAEKYAKGILAGAYGRMEFAICLGKSELWSKVILDHEVMQKLYSILVPVIRENIQENTESTDVTK